MKIDIQKDKDDVSFEEKVAMAIEELTHLKGVERGTAEKLVHAGFLTLEGIVEADTSDLIETTGLDEATVGAIKEAAAEAVAQIPEPQPKTDE